MRGGVTAGRGRAGGGHVGAGRCASVAGAGAWGGNEPAAGRLRNELAEPADKPGSVRRLRAVAVIPLGAWSPIRSSNLPGGSAGRINASLFGLAPGGVCRAGLLPDSRCALTAPFHPCHAPLAMPFGGIFLLHCPSAHAAQALPGTVPCGARTFLGIGYPMTRLPGRLRQSPFYVPASALSCNTVSPMNTPPGPKRRSQMLPWPA